MPIRFFLTAQGQRAIDLGRYLVLLFGFKKQAGEVAERLKAHPC